MKLAANVVAAMAWGLFLALVSYPFFAGGLEQPAQWATAVLMSFLVGLIVPSYLLRLEINVQGPAGARPESKRGREAS